MVVVIDTNVLLQCLARKNKLRPIWDAFLDEKYALVVSVSVKLEYEEMLIEKTSGYYAETILGILERAVNIVWVKTYFHWNVITKDPDDNKFFDAAFAANADYLITDDTHFNEAKKVQFPRVNIISADKFLEIVKAMG